MPDATQTGASSGAVPADTQNTRPLSPREEAMERLSKTVAEERAALVPPASEPVSAPEAAPTATPEASPLPLIERDGKFFAKVKIDEEEREVEYAQVVAVAQKNWAADKRLREAAQAYQQLQAEAQRLDAYRAELAAQQQQLKTNPPSPPKGADAETGDPDVDAKARQLAKALYEGDEDQVAQLVKETFLSRTQTPSEKVDSNQITQQVLASLQQEKQAAELATAWQTFQTEFSDIATDPDLYEAANRRATAIAQAMPGLPAVEVFRRAGLMVRERFAPPQPSAPAVATTLDRKRQAPGSVSGVNKSAPRAQQTPPPPSREDVLAEMRRARGQ